MVHTLSLTHTHTHIYIHTHVYILQNQVEIYTSRASSSPKPSVPCTSFHFHTISLNIGRKLMPCLYIAAYVPGVGTNTSQPSVSLPKLPKDRESPQALTVYNTSFCGVPINSNHFTFRVDRINGLDSETQPQWTNLEPSQTLREGLTCLFVFSESLSCSRPSVVEEQQNG